jgi:hypothetical protein
MRSSGDSTPLDGGGRQRSEPAGGFTERRATVLEQAVARTLPEDEHDVNIGQPWTVGVPIVDGGFHIPLRAGEGHFPIETDGDSFDARQSIDALLALRGQDRRGS